MRLKTLTGAAFAAAALALSAGPAFAGTGTVSPTADLVGGQKVTVTYSGFANTVFVNECSKSITDASFDAPADCDGVTQASGPAGSGSIQFTVFSGPAGGGFAGWACGSTNDPANSPVLPCFIRVVDTSFANTTGAFEAPITFASTAPLVPEVPYAVLLPLGAVAALGAGMYFNRRKALAA